MFKKNYKRNIEMLMENNETISGKDAELVAGTMAVVDTAVEVVRELPYYAGRAALFPMWAIMKTVESVTDETLKAYERYVEENKAQK